MTDLVIRPLRASEEHLFDSLPDPGLVGRALPGETYADGGYRPGRPGRDRRAGRQPGRSPDVSAAWGRTPVGVRP
ncbi:hypothetical protein [Micromonospora auratinigra]|uniref:Uncharacterized protein n=1 Tax=Micromonospora auratinigra TaxID=261654 RepID=A0A1A8ZC54_9ACTN|nr:hypothetical protein [Micromonospora auratinigra]SBT41432.1 hypothetical protein GA0070611_1618 [Micromonospora auratinigra]